MKWIYGAVVGGLCAVLFVGAPGIASAQGVSGDVDAERAALIERVAQLTETLAKLKQAQSSGIRVVIVPVWQGEERNISISSIRLLRKDEESSGETLSVYAKTSTHGFSQIVGENTAYEVYLYEHRDGRTIKLSSEPVAVGTFLVPPARGTVEFRAKLDESVFEGLAAGTELKAEVRIDTDRRIDERNEQDNKKMSLVWVLE